MILLIRRFAVVTAACAALWGPSQAGAGELLIVDGDRITRTTDPFVPERTGSDLAGVPGTTGRRPDRRLGPSAAAARKPHAAATRTAVRKRGPSRGQKAVARALRVARDARRIARGTYVRYRRMYAHARRTRKRLRGARGRELGSVIATLEAIATRRQLVASRMNALFLILRRNTQFWPRMPFPAARDRVSFRGSELLFEYYRGSGLQLQPLVNFKKANLMHGACVKATGAPCRPAGLRRLLGEMASTSSRRGGFRAWEYYFGFGGGRPPWLSGMAQATGIQGYGRAAQLLRDPNLLRTAREAFGAFASGPPAGIAARGPLGGTHYLQYSFAPRLFILNAFLQSLIGLHDYATITGDGTALRLFLAAEPEARAEVPHHDTGDWSTYSFGGRESTPEYHELLREFLASLCSRLRTPAYCQTARNFRRYATEPAELMLLGPQTVTQGVETRVSFSISKLSAVQVTITRNGETALDELATFRRGGGSFAWTPRSAGTYAVRAGAKELRTGRQLRTTTAGTIQSLPAP